MSAQSHLKAMCLNLFKAANRLSVPVPPKRRPGCLIIIGYPGRIKGGIWVKSGAIRGGNRRKPVFGFRLSGGKGILQRYRGCLLESSWLAGYKVFLATQAP